jgi:hypothetical protein
MQLKVGYTKTTTPLITDAGEVSAVRALDASTSTVIADDGVEVRVADAVVSYVVQDTAEKAAKQAKEEAAEAIRFYAGSVRDENALAGDYQKTMRVQGKVVKGNQYAVDVSQIDKFSVPKKKADIEALKTLLGSDFGSIMEPTVEISIKKSVLENDALRKELSEVLFKALGSEGIKKFFEREETWRVKKGMAETQYQLTANVRQALRANCKPCSDSIKDATGPVSAQ